MGTRRSLRLNTQVLQENVYCELDENAYMDTDDDLDQDMQQGHLCVSTDPRRVGGPGGEPTIITTEELRALLITPQSLEDQTVWLTTAQAGYSVTADTTELQNDRDRLLGKPVARFVHPAISTFIQERLVELNSKGQAPSRMEQLAKRLEETWVKTYSNMQTTSIASPKIALPGKATWEPDPKPLMANQLPRVTDSNTRIALSEGSLKGPCPQDDSGLGWVQIQRKSLLWEEKIEGFSVITQEYMNHVKASHTWNARTSSPQPDISSRR